MSLVASNSRILVRDSTGTKTVFDTDERMPAIIDLKEGVLTMPTRSGVVSTTTTDHTLATGINSNINFVYALISTKSVTSAYYSTVSLFGTVPVLGSAVVNFYGTSKTYWYYGTNWTIDQIRTITFLVSSGNLILREQYFNQMPGPSFGNGGPLQGLSNPIQGFDLRWRAFLGVV